MASPGSGDASAAAAAADEAFGADLYRILAGRSAGGLVFSPVSIAAALRLALLGARGDTATEIAAALHLGDPQEAGAGLRLLAGLPADPPPGDGKPPGDGAVVFRAPSTVWVQTGMPLRDGYSSAVAALAPGALRDADFAADPQRARTVINEVIAEQTAGRIPELLAPGQLDALARLVLANAVYLKAAWEHPFPASGTSDAPFYPEPGRRRTAAMMRLTARLGYLAGDGYQAVVLPYQGGRLAMTVFLPAGRLADLAERLTRGGIAALLAGVSPTRVRLGLPRFRQQARFELGPALQQLGVRAAFGGRADFSGITDAGPLAVGAVAHSAFIDVDEQGTEAAAATAVVIRAMAMAGGPVTEVVVDRPFIFAITDTATRLPLFLGRVTDPSAG